MLEWDRSGVFVSNAMMSLSGLMRIYIYIDYIIYWIIVLMRIQWDNYHQPMNMLDKYHQQHDFVSSWIGRRTLS